MEATVQATEPTTTATPPPAKKNGSPASIYAVVKGSSVEQLSSDQLQISFLDLDGDLKVVIAANKKEMKKVLSQVGGEVLAMVKGRPVPFSSRITVTF